MADGIGTADTESVSAVGWARVWPTVRFAMSRLLRRGVWYEVLDESAADRVTLGVGSRQVPVPRRILEIRSTKCKPKHFTVVHRTKGHPNPVEGTARDLGSMYAVCADCGRRTELFGQPTKIQCSNCGHGGDIAWWETG